MSKSNNLNINTTIEFTKPLVNLDAVKWVNIIGRPTKLSQFENDNGFLVLADTDSKYVPLTRNITINGQTYDLSADREWQITIPSMEWNSITGKPTFATVATTGSYNDLLDKPTIAAAWSDLTGKPNDGNYIFNGIAQQVGANFNIAGVGIANQLSAGAQGDTTYALYVNGVNRGGVVIGGVDSSAQRSHIIITTGTGTIGTGNTEYLQLYKDPTGWLWNSSRSGSGTTVRSLAFGLSTVRKFAATTTNALEVYGSLKVDGSITAASAIARGAYFNNTLTAAANNDVLVGVDIAPTFSTGAFTGTQSWALRVNGLSYFTDEVRIGSTTDQGNYRLQVNGGLYADRVTSGALAAVIKNTAAGGYGVQITAGDSAVAASYALQVNDKDSILLFRILGDGKAYIKGETQLVSLTGANSRLVQADASGVLSATIDVSSFAPASGSTNYIQNQNTAAQTANFWINGTGTAGTLQARNNVAEGGSLILRNDAGLSNAIFFSSNGTTDAMIYRNRANSRLLIKSNGLIQFSKLDDTNTTLIADTTNKLVRIADNTSDPSGGLSNSAMHYNSTSHQFRGYVNGTWRDLLNSYSFTVNGSITAASAIARGTYFNNTLVAAANNDVLVGVDIAPVFSTGTFTPITKYALQVKGNVNILQEQSGQNAYLNLGIPTIGLSYTGNNELELRASTLKLSISGFSSSNNIGWLLGNRTFTITSTGNSSFGVIGSAATTVPFYVKAGASQTANLQEWRDSANANLMYVTPTGSLFLKSLDDGTGAPKMVTVTNGVFGYTSGASGTFTSQDGKTITVTDGIITSIV